MTFSLGSTPRSLVKYNDQSLSAITEVGSGAGVTDDMVLIKELTASSSATLSFVDGTDDVVLDNTYPTYLFKFISIHPSAQQDFQFNMSIDAGSNYNVTKTTTAFGAYHDEANTSAALSYWTAADLAQATGFQTLSYSDRLGADNDQAISGYLHLFSPASTVFVKHFISRISNSGGSNYASDEFVAGYANTTSAVDAIQFKISSGNIDAGVIKLYGVT